MADKYHFKDTFNKARLGLPMFIEMRVSRYSNVDRLRRYALYHNYELIRVFERTVIPKGRTLTCDAEIHCFARFRKRRCSFDY